jgi:hypothetical protein
MKISNLLRNIAIATSAILLAACSTPVTRASQNSAATANAQTVKFQQIRNATVKVEYAGTTFLVDPMLAKKGAYPGFEGTYNSHLRNPLVELPMPVNEVMKADAIIVTHTHLDHWDDAAKQSLPKNMHYQWRVGPVYLALVGGLAAGVSTVDMEVLPFITTDPAIAKVGVRS